MSHPTLGRIDTLKKLQGEDLSSLSPQEMLYPQSVPTSSPNASAPSRASSSATSRTRASMLSLTKASPLEANPETDSILPLSIPTKHAHLFSGFPYHQDLYDISVSPKQWEQFNEDIQAALNPSRFDLATSRASRVPILPIGPIYLTLTAIKAANNRAIEKRILKSLQDDVGDKAGSLAAILKKWNDDTFAGLGLEVDIQLTSSAVKRAQKEEKKRKKEEQKVRKKYGTTSFYPDEEETSSPDSAGADSKYRIVISRLGSVENLPSYADSVAELPASDSKNENVPMLDSSECGVVEMPDTSIRSDLPVELPVAIPAVPELDGVPSASSPSTVKSSTSRSSQTQF